VFDKDDKNDKNEIKNKQMRENTTQIFPSFVKIRVCGE